MTATARSPVSEAAKRILCVEDDEDTRYMMRMLLGAYGYEPVIAMSSADALQLAIGGGFSLYILDNWMQQSSGIELCEQIRSFDSATPILFYSGAGYESDVRNGMNAGAQGYLIKPDLEHLEQTIERLISAACAC
jgi:CheY-like chemotaxis protein